MYAFTYHQPTNVAAAVAQLAATTPNCWPAARRCCRP